MIEVFHHIHHAVHRKLSENDPTVPDLPEEKNPVFFPYPVCLTVSLILAILWLTFRNFQRIIHVSLVGCAIGIVMMVFSGVMAMRHAEIHINLEEVTDDELLTHPIFIHNFILCILSILTMLMYLVHFWILYDCWQWRKKEREWENDSEGSSSDSEGSSSSSESTESSRRTNEPGPSRKSEPERSDGSDAIPTWETLKKKLSDVGQQDVENEPVILYCCCVDCWNYIKDGASRIPVQEFQVIHVK